MALVSHTPLVTDHRQENHICNHVALSEEESPYDTLATASVQALSASDF